MAALACGARSVVGIEARPEMVDRAVANLEHYGQPPDRFRFIAGDVHEVLNSEDLEVDVVLCLGFLYHTLRFNELLHEIRRTGAHHLVLDTQAHGMFDPDPLVRLHSELSERIGTAKADAYTVGASVLTGRPQPRGHRDDARLLRLRGRTVLRLAAPARRQPGGHVVSRLRHRPARHPALPAGRRRLGGVARQPSMWSTVSRE